MITKNALPYLKAGLTFAFVNNFQDLSQAAMKIETAYKDGELTHLFPESVKKKAASNNNQVSQALGWNPRGQQFQFRPPAQQYRPPLQQHQPLALQYGHPAQHYQRPVQQLQPQARPYQPPIQNQVYQAAQIPAQQPPHQQFIGNNPRWLRDRVFSPLPKPLLELFRDLKNEGIIQPKEPRPPPNPLPPNFRMDRYCEYHQNAGHSTEFCYILKNVIQDLIEDSKIGAGAPAQGNIQNNPLPNHYVNAAEENQICMIHFIEDDPPDTATTSVESTKPVSIESPKQFESVENMYTVDDSLHSHTHEDAAEEEELFNQLLLLDQAEKPTNPRLMIDNMFAKYNYQPGQGLDIRGQGMKFPLQISIRPHRQGLGYDLFEDDPDNPPYTDYTGRYIIPPLSENFKLAKGNSSQAKLVDLDDNLSVTASEPSEIGDRILEFEKMLQELQSFEIDDEDKEYNCRIITEDQIINEGHSPDRDTTWAPYHFSDQEITDFLTRDDCPSSYSAAPVIWEDDFSPVQSTPFYPFSPVPRDFF